MLDTLSRNNYQDFSQRYKDTFGFLHTASGQKIVRIKNINSEQVSFVDDANMPYHANADAGVMFEFLPCKRGLYNAQDEVVYVSRVPATQFKRGISESNTSIVGMLSGIKYKPTFDILEVVFNSKPNVLELCKEYLHADRACVALSKNFALVKTNIFFNDQKVGTVEKDSLKVSPLVFQELFDTVCRQSLPFQVCNV